MAKITPLEKAKEVIISYDCTDEHDPFREKLLELIKSKKYEGKEITLSTYKIGKKLLENDITEFSKSISDLFDLITENTKRKKKTVVTLIYPDNTNLIAEEIIKEVAN